jgi:hypothetical protein
MQNTQVSETKEFRCFYFELIQSKKELKSFYVDVTCYRGAVVAPKWKDVDPGWYLFGFQTTKYYLIASIDNYTELCTIEADLSHLPLSPRPKYSWGRNILPGQLRRCPAVRFDRVQGCDRLEGKRGSSHGSLNQFLLTVLSGC